MKVLQFPSMYRPGEAPYDIFKNRRAAILSIAGGIKNIIANKFINNQLSMIANNILNKVSEQKAIDLSNLITIPPPEEIYPDPVVLENTVGQFVDKFTMGPMMRKETMMGNLPAVGGVAPTAMPTTTPTAETMIPKMDMYQLYNVIKDLPSGEISWGNIYKKMTEKKPFFMGGPTGPEEFVLKQMLGQVTDPRAKIVSDINLAKLVKETFYPVTEEEKIKTEIDWIRLDPEGYAEGMRLKQSLIGDEKTAWEVQLEHLFKLKKEGFLTDEEVKRSMGAHVPVEKKTKYELDFEKLKELNLTDEEWKRYYKAHIPKEEVAKVEYYKTAAECLANTPKIPGFIVDPTFSAKGWYPNYIKEIVPKPTPEEEMREYYQKQFGTFKRNLLSGISDLGFIIDPENRDKYLSITFEEYMQFIKGEIPRRFSDDITVTDQTTGEKQKTESKTLFNRILNRIGLQKKVVETEEVGGALGEMVIPTEFQPEITEPEVPGYTTTKPGPEILGEPLPGLPKVPTEEKEALIPTMSDKELYDALKGLDPSDPIYKSLYDEAVKRGLL